MGTGTSRGIAALLVTVALLAALASGLGVFARGDGSKAAAQSVRGERYEYATTGVYRYNAERVVAEGVGWDVVTLFMVVPALLGTVPFVLRGSLRGRLVAAGLLGYCFYQYVMYALMWAFGPLFPVFIGLYSASLAGVVWIAATLRTGEIAEALADRFPARGVATYCFLMAALLVVMWSQRIVAGLGGDMKAAGLYGMPTMIVQALDLGLIVPLSVFTGVMALRRRPVGMLMSSIFLVKGFALTIGIAAMVVSAALVEGTLEVAPFAIFTASGLAALAMIVQMYRTPRADSAGVPAAQGA